MNKSMTILVIALFACGVEAHDQVYSEGSLRDLLRGDTCSYCDDYQADQARQELRHRQTQRQLRSIQEQQTWDMMQDFADRAHRR